MGNGQSDANIQHPASLPVNSSSHFLLPLLHLSNLHLLQIYHNVTSVTTQSCDGVDHVTLASRKPAATSDSVNAKCRYLEETLFHQCFAIGEDVSSDLFKAFDREEDGVVEWRHCLAGLVVCGDATLQQKCDLILSIFDLNERATVNFEEFQNVMSTSLLAAYRICQAVGSRSNEIHINTGAVACDVLEESLLATENKNGCISVRSLAALLEHNQTLKKALHGLGIFWSQTNSSSTVLMANSPIQKSPQRLRPIPTLSSSTNGIQHTFVWANVFPNHPSMPCARSRHAACHYKDQIYIHGGRNGNTTLKDFWKYDVTSSIWTQLNCGGDTPPPLQEHTMAAHNGHLYLFGGEFGFRDADEIPLWIFDTAAKSWYKQEIKSEVKTPCGRRGHTAVISHDAMHIYGGYVDLRGSIGELWSLDFKSWWWHLSPDNPYLESPIARHSHSAVVYNNAMWIYGGTNNLTPLKDLWKWDFCTRKWSRIKFWSGPPALYGHTAVISHNAMLIFGGQDGDGIIRNNLWKYHFGSQSWQKVVSHKGLIPPPSTHHILLSLVSTVQLDQSTPVVEDPRPSSAPHPSRQRKVTPLSIASEQIQITEMRPHSSPPRVTESDSTGKTQRKPFKNRIHPSLGAVDINIPRSEDSDFDDSASLATPLISSAKEQDTSAILSAMSPKRLFSPPKWVSASSKNLQMEDDSLSMQDTEVLCNPHAPDILIVEDISDVSSLSSAPDEEQCQPFVKECQPFAELKVYPSNQCNTPSSSPSHNKQGILPEVSVDPNIVSQQVHNKETIIRGMSAMHQSNQKLSTNHLKSALTLPLYNNLDLPSSKHSVEPDKNLNYKPGPSFMQSNILYPGVMLSNKVGPKADQTFSMHPQESSYLDQTFSAGNISCLTEQSVCMQDQKGHQNKEMTTNTQLGYECRNKSEQVYQQRIARDEVKCDKTEDNNKTIGATKVRPKLHGRSKTEQTLPLDRQAGGALALDLSQQQELSSLTNTAQDSCASNMSVCLILLGGQETTRNILRYITNPISMWKCYVIPDLGSKNPFQLGVAVALLCWGLFTNKSRWSQVTVQTNKEGSPATLVSVTQLQTDTGWQKEVQCSHDDTTKTEITTQSPMNQRDMNIRLQHQTAPSESTELFKNNLFWKIFSEP